AVELCIYLCKQFNLTEKNIICHCEGHTLGIASNHSDVMHWFPKHGKSMDTFRADVKAGLDDITLTATAKSEFKPYIVKVSIPNLNIRKGPGTDYDKTGKCTGIGAFTIVEERDGKGATKWGRLKSGLGWISLDYADKV
ncbi:MAG: N-acetylmuramoyl-L-alanine amidase, partial [Clostridia bacterium]